MMRFIVSLLGRLSGYFKLDVLYRIGSYLSDYERRLLALRLLCDDAEQITFRRDNVLWTGFVWDETVTQSLFTLDGYQYAHVQALLTWMNQQGRLASNKNVIIDVGANIGTSSIPFAQQTSCHVLAIEPVPKNFALLEQNVRQNNLKDRITCVQAAIYNSPGTIQMVLSTTSSAHPEINSPDLEPSFAPLFGVERGVVEAPTNTLLGIVEACDILPEQVAFVWSDTQGSEARVIETGETLWLAGTPLYVEISPIELQTQNGLEAFISLAIKYFDRFIAIDLLIKKGFMAKPRPISELATLIDALDKDSIALATDVLLLPKGYVFR